MDTNRATRYARIIEHIFWEAYTPGAHEVAFSRTAITAAAAILEIPLPKNLGDVVYSFRYRRDLPDSILATAPEGMQWQIRPRGSAEYAFVLSDRLPIQPNPALERIKVPDATPGIIDRYALNDEQALLARLRYNRLLDIFTGVTCYSLQNHLRTQVRNIGQTETDEVYVGIDRLGAHYVLPLQAKGGSDRLGLVQIDQDLAMCEEKFSGLICIPIAAQFMAGDVIAMFSFRQQNGEAVLVNERHYQLIPQSELSDAELASYQIHARVNPVF